MTSPDPSYLCPDGQGCAVNVCGQYFPKVGGPVGCWRARLKSLQDAAGRETVFNRLTGLFEVKA